ncbi:hypothetical protein M3Y94_00049300 [Aphelenchoides besseyi]|nr:hypothetical protein M3Y94_00049300 [Aphelenchoides besseyi]
MDRWCEQNDTKIQENDTGTSIIRPECPPDDFTEEKIRELNSDKLPVRNWTYGLDGICEGDDAKNCLESFIKLKEESNIYVKINIPESTATPAKFAFCTVRKSMSRILKQLSCMLTNPLNYLLAGHDLVDSALTPGCLHFPNTTIHHVSEGEKLGWTKENGWIYILITREPIDRFISGYLHQCVLGTPKDCKHNCYGCGANMTCFLEEVTKSLRKMYRVRDWISTETDHLMPTNWFCDLYKTYDKFTFLKYNDDSGVFFKRQLEPVLKKQNVSAEILTYIKRRMTSTRTLHSTNGFKLRSFLKDRILNSSYLTEMIVRLFYQDFKAFNFTLPTPHDQ